MYYIFQAMRPERWQVLLLQILAGLHLPWQPRAPGTTWDGRPIPILPPGLTCLYSPPITPLAACLCSVHRPPRKQSPGHPKVCTPGSPPYLINTLLSTSDGLSAPQTFLHKNFNALPTPTPLCIVQCCKLTCLTPS